MISQEKYDVLWAMWDSKYWTLRDFTDWADKTIVKFKNPPLLALELSLVSSFDEVKRVIMECIDCDGMALSESTDAYVCGCIYNRGMQSGSLSEKDKLLIFSLFDSRDSIKGVNFTEFKIKDEEITFSEKMRDFLAASAECVRRYEAELRAGELN